MRGTHASYIDISTLFGAEEINKRLFIDSVPQAMKRIQVNGYHVCKEGRYLFCVCIDYLGNILSQTEGSQTKSYTVFPQHQAGRIQRKKNVGINFEQHRRGRDCD